MTWRDDLGVLVTAALLAAMLAPFGWAQEKPNIVWECGQNVPNSAYWKTYSAELEEMLPFDGVMLKIEYSVAEDGSGGGSVGHSILGRDEYTEDMVKEFVDEMRAAGLRKLTQNLVYLSLRTGCGRMNYFDDEWWKAIQHNIRLVAKAAKDAGCAGLIIDPEQYGGDFCLDYHDLSAFTVSGSWAQYVAQVRRRGREFGEALSEGFPDCKLLFFHGYSLPAHQLKQAVAEGSASSLKDLGDLYPALLDGMLEGTSDGTIFIDGMELAYSYYSAQEFREGRWKALYEPLTITTVPDLFRKKTRCGFGLWTDNCHLTHWWHPFEPEKNLYSPGRLQRTIHLALTYSDGYVWLWNEKANWYVDGPRGKPHPPVEQRSKSYGMSRAYRDAVREARTWPGLDTSMPKVYELADSQTLGFIDREELERLLRRTKKVMDLPNKGWHFRADRWRVGVKEKWFLPETSTEAWDDFEIAEFWERVGDRKYDSLDGVGWYRRRIEFKEVPKDKRLYLHFGAVDESLHLWIDGKYVAPYSRTPNDGWDQPFAIDVTDFVSIGEHVLAIRAQDVFAMGGIWKPVSLIAE